MAGINAARRVQQRSPIVLRRDQAYIGVLIDDLVTRDIVEPYRIMTSRAEYRLLLRQDTADLRLSPVGHDIGLLPDARYERMRRKENQIQEVRAILQAVRLRPTDETNAILSAHGIPPVSDGLSALELLRRPETPFSAVAALLPSLARFDEAVCTQVEVEAKYAGYIEKQRRQVEKLQRVEARAIPAGFDYTALPGIRLEAREKLMHHRPATLGQASRLAGISPADLSVLLVHLERRSGPNGR
jgi:tRNA uridine 5-carboxymethylaminomethyl modification enzyme